MMSSPPSILNFPGIGKYTDEKSNLQIFDSEVSGSDLGGSTDVSEGHSKNVTRWPSTESLRGALPVAENFIKSKGLESAAAPSIETENAFVVEASIASKASEQITRFCTHQDITPNECLLLAFHAFRARTSDDQGERAHTPESLEMNIGPSTNFSLIVQNVKLSSIGFVNDSSNSLNCKTRCDAIQDSDVRLECIGYPDSGLTVRLISPKTTFDMERQRFVENLSNFWSLVVAYPFHPLAELPICGQREIFIQQQHYWSSVTTPNSWDHETVVNRIFRIAAETPHATAIVTSEGEVLTYDLLVHRCRMTAVSLQQSGVCPGDLIGLLAAPGLDEIIGMIAILLNRCGYVAMDPTFTTERLSFMANDSKMPVILITRDLTHIGLEVVRKSQLSPRLLEFPDSYLGTTRFDQPNSSGHDPFYTIYTSGSTGQPKGVVLTGSNTQQMLSSLHQDYRFSRFDRFLHHSSMCFDLSIVEIFSALTCGATVCVASAQARVDPEALGLFMKQMSITVTYFTPTKFALLLEACPESLQQCQEYRVAFFAGERLPVRVAERFYALQLRATMYNTWSPSELVVQTAIYQVPTNVLQLKSNIPIGFPLANSAHYIVDHNLYPVPIGMVGEICVGGAQVGRGYINTPGGKCKAFIENPFATLDYIRNGWTRLFRTGDKGRFLLNGELEFHGRIAGDKQIKLRGLRIHLGEVEQQIFKASKTARSAASLIDVNVTARPFEHQIQQEGMTDDRQLVAFLVPQSGLANEEHQKFVDSLHYELRNHLNEYMLPNGYEMLENLPMTIGGKVDIRNLQSRSIHPLFPSAKLQQNPVGAVMVIDHNSDLILSTVIDHFRTVLSLGEDQLITPGDNLFALGGNSMLVLVLQAKLKTSFRVKIPVSHLFKDPTPAAVAQLVREKQTTVIPKRDQIDQGPGELQIDWQSETTLPPLQAFISPQNSTRRHRSEISTILVTGADSFIGIHFIATILTVAPTIVIYILGSSQRMTLADLKISLARYQLLGGACGDLLQRVLPLGGTLAEPEFGLGHADFKALGKKIHAIYHIGGEVSLLKSYYDLKAVNVSSALSLISLAHYGNQLTELHYLSTWSIPHLQNWHSTQLTAGSFTAAEEPVTHFTPSTSPSSGGYLKARWATEMLLTRASERGFRVSIYRSSSITGSSTTKVPEPMYDLYRYTIMRMIQTRTIPDNFFSESSQFAIDFIPVDYLASTLFGLGASPAVDNAADGKLSIYHIGNPNPLAISELLPLIPLVRRDGVLENRVRVLPFDDWMAAIADTTAAGDDLRVAALKGLFSLGHVPFSLKRSKTAAALALVLNSDGGEGRNIRPCPPVGVEYLQEMLKSSW